jgi:pilus assembly protein CpaE
MFADEITLLIVDDSPEMVETLKTLLTFNEMIKVVGEARSGEEAIEKVLDLKPDLVLMDINMPGMDGLKATEEINIKSPRTGVIIISVQDEVDYMRRAMAAGARDYLVKPFDSDELFRTIQSVIEKEKLKWEAMPSGREIVAASKPGEGKVISVFSTKGGVGKSTIAANIGVEIRKQTNSRVLLIDLDLQFGDLALLLNVSPKTTIANLAQVAPNQLEADYFVENVIESSYGVSVLAAPIKPEYAEVVTGAVVERVIEIARGLYEFVIIDTNPSFQAEVLTALDASDDIVLIVAPDFLSLKNVTLGLSVMASLNYPVEQVTLALNRALSVSSIKLADVERGLQRKVDVEIPSDGEVVVASINRGTPFVITHPTSGVAKAIAQLAQKLIKGSVEDAKKGKPREKGILKKMFGKKGAS